MRAGRLDRRVTFLAHGEGARDAYGHPAPTSTALVPVWASVEYVRDSERVALGQLESEITIRVRTRWSAALAALDTRCSLTFEARDYDIVAIKEVGRREGLEFSAKAAAEKT